MAQLKQSEIIAEAKIQAGRKAENLNLDKEFDWITKEMSRKYALLPTSVAGSITADQNYIALPSDFRSQRLIEVGGRYQRRFSAFKVGSNWLGLLNNPRDFYYYDQTEYGTSIIYAAEPSPAIAKIYFYPKTETDTPAYEFHYYKLHPKASGTPIGDYLHLYGEMWDDVVIHGVAWKAAWIVKEMKIAAVEQALFYDMLYDMVSVVAATPRSPRVTYYHF